MERWLPVVGFEGLYEVSDFGRVRSLPRRTSFKPGDRYAAFERSFPGRILCEGRASKYRTVALCRDGSCKTVTVHRVVLEAFRGLRPEGMECRHLDGDPANNRLANLTWGTHAENCDDRARHGTHARGERCGLAALTESDVRMIRRSSEHRSTAELARVYGVGETTIRNIRKNRTWRHVEQ